MIRPRSEALSLELLAPRERDARETIGLGGASDLWGWGGVAMKSEQPVLTDLFVVEVEQLPSAPYQKTSETSKAGAEAAQGKLSRQLEMLLALYISAGPLTDWEAHKRLGWERTTVIARRHGLGKRVEKLGTRKNPDSGIENDVYGLAYGWATR